MYIHKHASYNGKRGHTFGKKEVEVHGSVCREEGGKETCCNYNLKNKIIKRLSRLAITKALNCLFIWKYYWEKYTFYKAYNLWTKHICFI